MKIVAVGECTIDRYLDAGVDRVGGISLNFAIQASRVGAETALVSCAGDDGGRDRIVAWLDRWGVDRSRVRSLPGRTAEQDIRLGAGGERSFPPGGYRPGVLQDFGLSTADLAFIGTFDVVAVPWFRQIEHLWSPVMENPTIRGNRVADLLDGADLGPALERLGPLLGRLDLTFMSGEESLVPRLEPLCRRAPGPVVITHGAAGASVLIDGHRIRGRAVPVPPGECRDSTGCGDAFQAAFTVEYFRSRAIDRALAAGADLAATAIRHLGATPEPDRP